MYLGLGIGLLSAAVLVVFSALNKVLASRTHPLSATCIEMGAGAVFLALMIGWLPGAEGTFALPHGRGLYLLLVFAVALTAVPIALMLLALRRISVFAQQMAVNLELVYAVLLAIAILGEQRQLDPLFYLGVIVIIGAVMAEPAVQWFQTGRWRKHPKCAWPCGVPVTRDPCGAMTLPFDAVWHQSSRIGGRTCALIRSTSHSRPPRQNPCSFA